MEVSRGRALYGRCHKNYRRFILSIPDIEQGEHSTAPPPSGCDRLTSVPRLARRPQAEVGEDDNVW
jgi:hypothetical protein